MKIGGANAPPTVAKKPQKHGFGRIFTAWVWPGGQTQMVGVPGFERLFYPVLNFSFQLLDLMKLPLIVSFNRLI